MSLLTISLFTDLLLGTSSDDYELKIGGDIFYSIMKHHLEYISDSDQHSPEPAILGSLSPLITSSPSCLNITLKAHANPSAAPYRPAHLTP